MRSRILHNLILVFAVCLLCVLFCGSALAEEAEEVGQSEIPVYVDDMLACRGYIINGETCVSIESVCGVLDREVLIGYDTEKALYTFTVDGVVISVGTEDEYMCANGRCIYLPGGCSEVNDTVVFPLSAVAKIFNLSFSGDGDGVYIDTANEAMLQSGDEFYNEEDVYWLSRIITWESGNQPLAGQIGVGNVVQNRIASERFPDTLKEVIFQPGQFFPAMNGAIYGDPYDISVIAAKLALEGVNTVGDALFFQTGRYGAVADMATYVCTIAGHNFFR